MSEPHRCSTSEWKWRRRETLIRDNYTCQGCGVKGGPEGNAELHAHHKTTVAEGGTDELKNLETLCQDCHKDRHSSDSGSGRRALLTEREREIISGDATDVSDEYRYQTISRIRSRLQRLDDDIDALEAHGDLADELREIVCEDGENDV